MTNTLTPPVSIRPLSLFESMFSMSSATIRITAHVEGRVDLDTLGDAWSLLRTAHPVLAARLVPGSEELAPGVPVLNLTLPASPAEPILVRDGADLRPEAEPLRADGPLARLEVTPGKEKTLVSLAVFHAIADGRLALHWNRELWSSYTRLSEGHAPAAEPRPVPKAPETLLVERGFVKTDLATDRVANATPSTLPDGKPGETSDWLRILLSASDTARLRAYARSQGQTVHGLVAGAVAVATRRFLPATDGREIDLALSSPVDIRGRVDPVVPVWGGTNVLGFAEAVVAVRPGSDPVVIGSEVVRQLAEDLETGAIHQSFLRIADNFDKQHPSVPHAMTTNVGALEPIPTPSGTTIAEVQGSVHWDWSPVIAAMEASGRQTGNPMLTSSMHIILTYQDRLSIDLAAYLPESRAREYADTLENLLLDIAARDSA